MQYIGEILQRFSASGVYARYPTRTLQQRLVFRCLQNPIACYVVRSGVKLGFNSNFAEFSGTLVESVTSSAGLERQFSTIGMSYGKLRSNLDVQKTGKMAFLYRQLNSS